MSEQDPGGSAPTTQPVDTGALTLSDAALESITELIVDAQKGRPGAWDQVYSALYRELHRLARMQIRQHWKGAERSPTSLINRTWLRLSQATLNINDRTHLISVLVHAMRYALVDETRRLLAEKRGVGFEAVMLEEDDIGLAYDARLEHLLAVDQALNRLSEAEPRLGLLVELRYFGGMTDEEVAQALGVTDRTVRRDWRRARAFLSSSLDDRGSAELGS
ncbi:MULTISPECIES: ECF-type sigma factor [unclassified Lysobacter]|uniref:ECF-type sigma factor n=1 Tax=unclassified Lysobacter TaxID=2635362 RepID=UPI001BEC511E|nr:MULTISPECIES: ECF-type sigma factor [unclassified Lysobacter]MBT2749310.1 sigma-70 family RNA polymerase sigma factor [Lysobacter sp. ISL-42]MBT2753106.1 sigma-70 family RNA polymerase sigma factor [Lysobacter sp. ISL-50]MBT2777275.1 sigma-70 family RNA polymerase sigma factor [Lysobacter sp. ISL-54]MBT2783255.1 sigma-70 family RNA polymerase sigma factor [Lysobacter sp. ISL-52]